MQQQSSVRRLLTAEFLALNLIMFLTYCNIAVFFQFQTYLGTLPRIPAAQSGLLIGLFSVSVIILRPLISPFITARNAKSIIMLSCISVMVSLFAYNMAHDVITMAIVRLVHGIAYVFLAVAVLTKMVAEIPPDRSGQAFGLIAVITVLPYALVPPIIDPLIHLLGGFGSVLNASALLMLLTLPLLVFIKRVDSSIHLHDKPTWSQIKINLKDPAVSSILFIGLIVWSTFTPVFYFIAEQAEKLSIGNAGWFFTLSTVSEIGVRLVFGKAFDSGNKAGMLAAALGILTLGYILLANVCGPVLFYSLGILLGLGWGVSMPLLNGLMFDVSDPRFRALNSNLAMQMFQCGFFIGPVIGHIIMVKFGYLGLYYSCAAVTALGAGISLRLKH